MFEIRKRLCSLSLIGEIVPEHCTTIPKAALYLKLRFNKAQFYSLKKLPNC